jgi:hypothetical protein
MYQIVPNKHTLKIIPLFVVMLMLGGCLVDSGDSRQTINRTNNDLVTITNGIFYQYDVRGQITNDSGSSQFITGTLRVEYYADTLSEPFGSAGSIPNILREETTLNLGTTKTTTRYFQQNTDGSLVLLAANPSAELFRTSSDDDPGTVNPVTFLTSPVALTGDTNINFNYMRGCEATATCTGIAATVVESVTYSGDAIIDTRVGKFNAIRHDFSGSITTSLSNALFDFRWACSTGSASFSGQTYIFPEVGVVLYDYLCDATDGVSSDYSFTVELTQTNVPIPNP